MFGDSNSKIILQCNGKELTVRNTEIDMNFVKKGCRESNGELQGPQLCVQLATLLGFVYDLMFLRSAKFYLRVR